MDINIGVVITHFRTLDKTVECMKSFFACDTTGFNVQYVIVDNGSKDGSYEELSACYSSSHKNVRILSLSKNIPFARAMDEGVKYLNSICKMDFIIMSNNDIIIKDESLFKDICLSYKKNSFAVMGPNVYSVSTNTFSNPIQRKANFTLRYNVLSLFRSYYDIITKKWMVPTKLSDEVSNENNGKPQENIILHGCFLVFSRLYLDRFPNGLYPQNSFYMEENILYYLCKTNQLKTFYEPSIYIEHIHSVSIKKMFDNNAIMKNKFTIVEHKKSKLSLIKIIILTKLRIKITF